MKKISIIIILFACLGIGISAKAQILIEVDSVAIDSTLFVPVSLDTATVDTAYEKVPAFTVVPWEFHAPLASDVVATDSTLRWQFWPDWTYKLNREPGVISYRLGTGIRTNAVQMFAHEPRHQQLYWENINLNDPVTGTLNWSVIPQRKIDTFYQQDLGTQHRSSYNLRQYYLNEPLSKLNYSESSYTFRNLEFEVSHNISQRTNIEMSYWDRRMGGEFPNSEITGRQIFAKASHHLDERRFLKLNYIHNKYNAGQPFGYVMNDMRTFPFDRFSASANEPSASSERMGGLVALTFYQRSADTTQSRDDFQAGIYYRGNERTTLLNADTTGYKIRNLGSTVRKWWDFEGLSLEGRSSYNLYLNPNPEEKNLSYSNWGLFEGEGRVLVNYLPVIDLISGAAFKKRSDGFDSYRVNLEAEINAWQLQITSGISTGTIMPTPQQLYWQSDDFVGNGELINEEINEAHASAQFQFASDSHVGIRMQHKDIFNGILVTTDTTFQNSSPYSSQSGTAYFQWNMTNFEFNGSATIHRFSESFRDPAGFIPMNPQERIWFKGGAYWKGYLFDRATYVKAGVSGMLTPYRYQADHYNPVLDYWQPVSDNQLLPAFDRMDVDISARIRSLIFSLRWENVLDDVSQLGYFETAQYPMAQRRFIFSVRALFRN